MSWSMLGVPGPLISVFLKRAVNIIRVFLEKAKAYLKPVSPHQGRVLIQLKELSHA
jgi:hypothetical protein